MTKEELILDLNTAGQALGSRLICLGRVLAPVWRDRGPQRIQWPPSATHSSVELPRRADGGFLSVPQMRTPGGQYVPLADIDPAWTGVTGFSARYRREKRYPADIR